MQYNLTKAFKNTKENLLQDFLEKYTACIKLDGDFRMETVTEYYRQIFETLTHSFESQELLDIFKELAEFKISLDIPYVVMSNELYGLENIIISNITKEATNEDILKILALFNDINNTVAFLYLERYIDKLISVNTVRRNSLSDLVEKNLIQHYEAHLIWLTSLASHIKNRSTTAFPELDDSSCAFGKWLHTDGKSIIHNNSKYKTIETMHKNLHLFAKKIYNILQLQEYHILITYLEKCELISLSIGTELALLDQMQMNKKIAKDSLTGSLNRNALDKIFESQYEVALAIGHRFVVAMCDLDHFKQINDTYGHVAGDKVLKKFVETAKKVMRNSDIIIRYGGEEFVIMLPAIDANKGLDVLERIRQEFATVTVEHEGEKIQATVSIGMLEIVPDKSFELPMIEYYLMQVDKKLYMAKEYGRNQIYM